MKYEDETIIYVIGIICATVLIVTGIVNTSNRVIDVEYSCNSGFIGVDYEKETWITPTNEDADVHKLKVKNIDGLNCNGKIHLKNPDFTMIKKLTE